MPRWPFRKDRQQPSVGPVETPHAQQDAVGSSVHSASQSNAPTSLPDRVKAPAPGAISSPPSSVLSAILPIVVGVSASGQDEAPAGTASSGATIKKKDYWQLAVEVLQREDSSTDKQITAVREAVVGGEHTDLPALLLQAAEEGRQALEAKRWTLKIGSRSIGVHEQFDRLINAISLFKDVGGAAASLDPLHAGIPFAGFCTLLQMATNDTDLYMTMVVGVEEIITILARYHEIERLYHKRSETALKQNFETRMISLYKNIVRYQISAISLFRRNTILRILRSFPKLDDVSDVMDAIRRDDNACKDIDHVFQSSDADERHQDLLVKLESLEKCLGRLEAPEVRASAENKCWGVTRQLNALFTGRVDILHELENIVRDHVGGQDRITPCQIVISGMGGQGKSELCLQLVHLVWPMLWGAFWVDVSSQSTAERDFLAIGHLLGSPAQSWEGAQQKLARVEHPWLLVLDNADDPDMDYQQYFPAGATGVMALTSRNEECAQYAITKHVALAALPDEAAQELILTAARLRGDDRAAAHANAITVANLLNSHPLALIQAGAYISRGHCTMGQYPEEYARQRKRLMRFRPKQASSRYGDVFTTFEASAEALSLARDKTAWDALELLPMLAVCGPSRLPLPLFKAGWEGAQTGSLASRMAMEPKEPCLTAWHISHLPSLIMSNTDSWDSFRLLEAVNLLKSFSLLSTDTSDGYVNISMHALVHAWARDRESPDEQHMAWLKMACLVALSVQDEVLWLKQARQLRSHLRALVSWEMTIMFGSEPVRMIVLILERCGLRLYDMRDHATLCWLLRRLLENLGITQSKVDAQWLSLYRICGANLTQCGQAQGAVKILEEVLEIQRQTQAEDDQDLLSTQSALAGAYLRNEQVEEALVVLEEVARIRRQTLAENDRRWLSSQHALAMAYEANRQGEKAVTTLEELVRIREQIMAEDDPDRRASQHVLAMAYSKAGQAQKAVMMLEKLVRIEEQTLAEDHPDRLSTQYALARAYRANGQIQEAATMLEVLERIEGQELAEDNPLRLMMQHEFAVCLWNIGQPEKAIRMMEHVVEVRQSALAGQHPDRKSSEEFLEYMLIAVNSKTEAS